MPWQGPGSHKEVFHTCLPALRQHQRTQACRLRNAGLRTSKVPSCPVSNESGSKKVQSWPSKKIFKINFYMYYIYISQEDNSLPSASHIFQSFHLKSTGLESPLSFNEGWASCGLTWQQEVLLTEKPRMVGDFDSITRVGNTGRRLWIKLSDLLGPSAFTAKQNNFSGL